MDALDLGIKAAVFVDLSLLGLVLCAAAVRLLAAGAIGSPVTRAAAKADAQEHKAAKKAARIGSIDLE